ncbi:FAD-dependent oxidoreductase [Francisellaceae bacterium]|nr:FAD-dependent oxidoreductase [Francisellaceae bacterium]
METFDWLVVGAGAAGIASIGKLLDEGIQPKKIAWIDPEFNAGDLGKYWSNVSSNTDVSLFTKFFNQYSCFNYAAFNSPLKTFDQNDKCQLIHAADALKWVTSQLIDKVNVIKGKVDQLKSIQGCAWQVKGNGVDLIAKKVILAQGSDANTLNFDTKIIPLDIALNKDKLQKQKLKNKKVAVFGSSHSAVIIIQSLLEQGAEVANFYRSPLVYAVNMGDWLLHDGTGLKGKTAEWAKENLHSHTQKNLKRYLSNKSNIDKYLPVCDYAVYATGFKKRAIKVDDVSADDYDPRNGIIAPGVFGVGIAYPELATDPYGHQEYHVGLYKFMKLIDRVFPLWQVYPQAI